MVAQTLLESPDRIVESPLIWGAKRLRTSGSDIRIARNPHGSNSQSSSDAATMVTAPGNAITHTASTKLDKSLHIRPPSIDTARKEELVNTITENMVMHQNSSLLENTGGDSHDCQNKSPLTVNTKTPPETKEDIDGKSTPRKLSSSSSQLSSPHATPHQHIKKDHRPDIASPDAAELLMTLYKSSSTSNNAIHHNNSIHHHATVPERVNFLEHDTMMIHHDDDKNTTTKNPTSAAAATTQNHTVCGPAATITPQSTTTNTTVAYQYRFGPGQPLSEYLARSNNKQKSSVYVGVRRRQWGTYAAEIRNLTTGSREWLGTFESAEEAAVVYDMRLRQIKGMGARCNFPPLNMNGILCMWSLFLFIFL